MIDHDAVFNLGNEQMMFVHFMTPK
jgi:hypothetical protein